MSSFLTLCVQSCLLNPQSLFPWLVGTQWPSGRAQTGVSVSWLSWVHSWLFWVGRRIALQLALRLAALSSLAPGACSRLRVTPKGAIRLAALSTLAPACVRLDSISIVSIASGRSGANVSFAAAAPRYFLFLNDILDYFTTKKMCNWGTFRIAALFRASFSCLILRCAIPLFWRLSMFVYQSVTGHVMASSL